MTRTRHTKILLIVSMAMCVVTIAITFNVYKEKRTAQYWVDHTYEVIEKARRILAHYKNAEIAHLAYQSSSDVSLLWKLQNNVDSLRNYLHAIRSLTNDNHLQTTLIETELLPMVENRISEIRDDIALEGRTISKLDLEDLNKIQNVLDRLILKEKELLMRRHGRLVGVTSLMIWWIYSSLSIILLSVTAAYFAIRTAQKKNESLMISLQSMNEDLERKVDDQTKKVTEANKDLVNRNNELATLNEELRASEEELKSSLDFINALKNEVELKEKQYRFLAERSQDMITIVGLDSKIEYTSPGSKNIVQYEPDELIGRKGFDLVYHEDRERVERQMLSVNQHANHVANFQFRMVRKDGSLVWVESQTTPILDDAGKVIKRQTTVHDISLAKKAEEEILIAKEKAEEATMAKSQFLSTMSHEIRTPLNAVVGLTHILLQNNPLEEQVEHLNLLKFSSENLLNIINDILDFSKIEANKVSLEAITFNLGELMTKTKTVLQKRVEEKAIQLNLKLAKDLPSYVIGDPLRLNQVITNLLSNAIKFTEEGYVELSVDCRPIRDGVMAFEFKVHDTGIGIERDKLNQIFESFSQASSDTSRRYGGTGLGLTISKKLVEMMGGRIQVESTPNKGSTFSFEIEMQVTDPDDQPSKIELTPLQLENREANVLLVEDNRINQIVASNFLTRWGINVDFANNGVEALEKIKSKSYHLVLMDLQMPEMDGYSAARSIRGLPGKYFETIPIIALSASAMFDIQKKVFDCGMNDYISKPFNPEDLRTKVFSFLNLSVGERLEDKRPWTDAFNLYLEGDATFKKQIAELLVSNLKELMESATAYKLDSSLEKSYAATLHRVRTSIIFLGDEEFKKAVEKMSADFSNGIPERIEESYRLFTTLCRRLITDLKEEFLQ